MPESYKHDLTIEMNSIVWKQVQFLLIFVILEILLSVSYILNCMVVMYQSTFFLLLLQQNTELLT